jgi:hypothetical protein
MYHCGNATNEDAIRFTDIEGHALGARLYCCVDEASVPVAASGTIGALSLAADDVLDDPRLANAVKGVTQNPARAGVRLSLVRLGQSTLSVRIATYVAGYAWVDAIELTDIGRRASVRTRY